MAFDDDDDDDEPSGPFAGVGLLTVVLPFVATILSLIFGIFIGGLAAWVIKPTERPIEYLKTASLAELQMVCEPVVEEQKTQLAEVNDEIDVLRSAVTDRENEVIELRAKLELAERGGGPGRPSSSGGSTGASAAAAQVSSIELQRAREELAEARLQLSQMRSVKEQLVDQLTRTRERLVQVEQDLSTQMRISEVLKVENDDLRDDNLVQSWYRFIYSTQLSMCEKGSRKKTDTCRLAVDSELAQIKNEFVHCMRSGQAAPVARELDRGDAVPRFAKMMDQDNKPLKGWYLQLCDPTLPELSVEDRVPAPSAVGSVPASFGSPGG